MRLSAETQNKIIQEVIKGEGDAIAKKLKPMVLDAINNLFKTDDFRIRIENCVKQQITAELEDGDLRDWLNQKQSDALSKRIASTVMGCIGVKE